MNIPYDVIRLIASYLVEPKMKLLDWIPLDKIDWSYLSSNPNAIHLLEQNIDKIDWKDLSRNPNAISILEQNMDEIRWSNLSENPNAIQLLEQNMDKIEWLFYQQIQMLFICWNKIWIN